MLGEGRQGPRAEHCHQPPAHRNAPPSPPPSCGKIRQKIKVFFWREKLAEPPNPRGERDMKVVNLENLGRKGPRAEYCHQPPAHRHAHSQRPGAHGGRGAGRGAPLLGGLCGER
jgi:hypothetical protein